MATTYSKICKGCGINFTVPARDKNQHYHNSECFKASTKKKEYNCTNCGSVTHSPKFCSKSCAATFNNLQRDDSVKRGCAKLEVTRIRQCQMCQKWHTRIHSKYCSKDCVLLKPTGIIKYKRRKTYTRSKQVKVQNVIVGTYTKIVYNTCAHSKEIFISYRKFKYSPKFRNLYSREGKAAYGFMFNVFDYPDLFDLELLKKNGWFSVGNKGKPKNLSGVSRDHKVSVTDAIKYGYDPYYITHPFNCELMEHSNNIKKYNRSSITYDELVSMVDNYEKIGGKTGIQTLES
jgi:hypothetical protein